MFAKIALCAVAQMVLTTGAMACSAPTNSAVQNELAKDLAKFKNVTVTVDDCVAELNGQVDRFNDKERIEMKARNFTALTRVIDHTTVGGPTFDDAVLAKKLRTELSLDWATQGMPISVTHGAVTVFGVVRDRVDRGAVLWAVGDTRGVKDVIDHIQIDTLRNLDGIIDWQPARSWMLPDNYAGPAVPWNDPWRRP